MGKDETKTARDNFNPMPRLSAGRAGLAQSYRRLSMFLYDTYGTNWRNALRILCLCMSFAPSPVWKIMMRAAVPPLSIHGCYKPIRHPISIFNLHPGRRRAPLPRKCRLLVPNLGFKRYSSTNSQPRPTLNAKAKRLVVLEWPTGGTLSL